MSTASSPKIRILPPHIVNRIAAGEVVERPASVVKELVENALDAGATRIEIHVGAAGRTLRIADNGCGMTPEDAAVAFFNHATSKIRDERDLDCIRTLGFRGEALASIASISKLTCLTRTADAETGSRITLDALGNPQVTEAGCAPGTVMEVAELFYNTPARLKFLKRPATELGHIEETVQYLAISHPEVQFTLALNDKTALKTSGSGQLQVTLDEVFNLKRENTVLVPVTFEDREAGLTLAGYASTPGLMKSSKRWLVTYVNNRHVRCATLTKAIESAYESLLPHGKYPICVFFVGMPADEVDVNVHPAKREVRYASGNSIFSFVRQGIRSSLENQSEQYGFSMTGHREEPPADPLNGLGFAPGASVAYPQHSYPLSGPNGPKPLASSPASFGRNGSGGYRPEIRAGLPTQSALNFYAPAGIPDNGTPAMSDLPLPASDSGLSPDQRFKVVGQLYNTYILLETVQGLMVVDQHIASERTFFESLSLNILGDAPAVQQLLAASPIAVSPLQAELLTANRDAFARLGFSFDMAGNATVTLTGIPLIYQGRDQVNRQFEHLLAQLEETGEMKLDLDNMIATLSCHSAVRAGDPLTSDEMVKVIERWLQCRLPWTCPHGRPIAHTIPKEELNHFFHRPSLPVSAI